MTRHEQAIREEYEERAAIREHLGGVKRGVAELEARKEIEGKYGPAVRELLR